MKKALALLVAFATALSISVTAFADAMPQGMADSLGQGAANNVRQGTAGNDLILVGDEDTNNASGTPGISNYNIGISPMNLEITDENYTIAEGEIFYVWTDGPDKGFAVAPGTVLVPGTDYTFDIYRAATATTAATPSDFIVATNAAKITKGDLGTGRLRVRTVKGAASIATADLKEKGSGTNMTYQLEVKTKANYGTKLNDVQYDIEMTGGPGTVTIVKSGVAWKVGFKKMTDSDIEGYEEGDTITIYNDRPVISKKQFDTIAKNYNYRTVIFENEEATWTFTGRVSGMADTNFYNTQEIIPNVVMDNPDTDFKFVNFHGGVKFPTNGEMRIDVSDISGDFASMYVYLSRGGALTPIAATHDRETDEIVFKTNYLGTFIIADTEIAEVTTTEPTEPTEPGNNYAPTTPNNPNNNPAGGASSVMNLITTLGLTTLTGAGAVLRKRK